MKDCEKRKKWNMALKAYYVNKMHLTTMLKKKSLNEMDVHLCRQWFLQMRSDPWIPNGGKGEKEKNVVVVVVLVLVEWEKSKKSNELMKEKANSRREERKESKWDADFQSKEKWPLVPREWTFKRWRMESRIPVLLFGFVPSFFLLEVLEPVF